MTIQEFIAKWRKVELKERSAAQEHFLDLCNVFGHPTPAAADPTGESFCFEKGAAKHGGGDGFADVWKRGFSGWEYKGKHKDLTEAYDQLLRYRDALESPPLLVCCDLDRIVIHTNFTGTVSATHDIPLAALAEPRNIEIMRAVFHDPDALRPGRTSTAVTQDAASQFAEIAAAMRARGLDPAAVAHFLDRLVFCLFAEDIRLLPDMVFSRIVQQAAGDPARFSKILAQLFDTMATGGDFGLEPIRHFNGNLFDDHTVLDLTADEVKRITAAASLDWSAVDPSIFGTLFERGLDPNTRAQLGAHFTSRADIELVVDAVVMAPLRREWAETKAIVESLLATGRKHGSAGVPHASAGGAGVSPAFPGSAAVPAEFPGRAGVSPAFPGGAGVSPASSGKPPREWHSRGYLPHFDHPGMVQTITFRLADSLPANLVERLNARKEKTDDPALRQEIEDALDASFGACHLRDPRVAGMVQNALLHFDAERYRLLAWVVMPNHVHAMIETRPGSLLDEIVHSWKSFTAHECNRLLRRHGAFWQDEYYDRFIRDGEHFRKAKEYIEQNPVKAGLVANAADWRFGSAGGAAVPATSPGGAGVSPAFPGGAGVSPAFPGGAGVPPALPGKALTTAQLRKARDEADSILHQFLVKLRAVKILDPACGSGNFLYVALLRLKDLEKEAAVTFPVEHGLNSYLPGVSPLQLYGIETNAYAHDLAQMTVWIGWLQWIRANGFGYPADPILKPLTDNIRHMDAILSPGGAGVPPAFPGGVAVPPAFPGSAAVPAAFPGGAAVPAASSQMAGGTPALPGGEPDWPKVDFIIGNPPFLGDKLMRRELGDAYVDRLRALYADRIPGQSDLCCYWFEKARAHIAADKCKRAGLLATQGIRGGANREVLKRIKDGGGIFWAESDRPWILDGANVHVSMIGFDDGTDKTRMLDGTSVATINSNLTSIADFASAQVLSRNSALSFIGTTKGGSFDIPDSEAQMLLRRHPNPHGRPNSDVLRPILNGLGILRRGDARWVIDNEDRDLSATALYEAPHHLVVERVKPARDTNRNRWLKDNWWKLQRVRGEMRAAIGPLPRFLASPRVAKHRVFLWFSWPTVTDDQTVVFARSDDYFFGVLQSRFHEVWALAQGTQLREKESGFRYTPTTCFETFPFPGSAGVPPAFPGSAGVPPAFPNEAGTDALPGYAAIAAAAKQLNELREGWLNPPDWTRPEVLEFPGTVGGPWDRYIDPATVTDRGLPAAPGAAQAGAFKVGTVRYPRLVARDADCAARLKERTLTKLYNERPPWLADCHARLDAAVAAAYGWPADLPDEAILERLLALNQAAAHFAANTV